MDALVEAIVEEVPFRLPFALFGHSFGALVAFEVVRALRRCSLPRPDHLYLSSCPPPPPSAREVPLHTLSDEHLLSEVERLWGELPGEIRASPELRSHALGRYRADLEVLETYRPAGAAPLDCPLTAIGGTDDAASARLSEWRAYTHGRFGNRTLPGDHFYFRHRRSDLLQIIHQDLCGGDLAVEKERLWNE
jgi:surfactin synthase thioesterase subunit